MDKDGYPDDDELDRIAKWDHNDPNGWFEYIRDLWWMSEWGWRETETEYHISTGGWSGNESIISAMEENFLLWVLSWVQERRGGHYIFEKKNRRSK